MNTPAEEKIPILLASNVGKEPFGRQKATLLETTAPQTTVTPIPATLFDVLQHLSGTAEGLGDQESEVLDVLVPQYRAIILGTNCLDDPGVVGTIPATDNLLSEFAPLLNYAGLCVPADANVSEAVEKETGESLERKRQAMVLFLTKIREKQPGALLFWLREINGDKWSEMMKPEHPVLEEYPTGTFKNFGRQWALDVATALYNSMGS